uniref:Uncharacterized protein n=1 Tax=Mycena chlorophos TaxID=658473 RepID=A0ABQ0KW82_MYCCL|nr:predicted protein [Mycena chlorophos]
MAPTDVPTLRPAHGGSRAGAGRATKEAAAARRNQPPPRRYAETRTAPSGPQPAPAAFFLPRRSDRPVPGTSAWNIANPDAAARPIQPDHVGGQVNPVMTSEQVSQLSNDLNFISENDEYGDIAGDAEIDESLVDEIFGADTQSSDDTSDDADPTPDSASARYLASVKTRIVAEIAAHGRPLCYARGDLFDRAPHPIFHLSTCFVRTETNQHPDD